MGYDEKTESIGVEVDVRIPYKHKFEDEHDLAEVCLEMIRLKIDSHVSIVTAGIADRFGERSSSNRNRLQAQVSKGKLRAFLWEGCESLITEDHKFLLGIHYLSYKLGPHVIPVLDENLEWFEEKRLFDTEVMPLQVQL